MHGRRQVPRRSPSLQDSIIFKRHEEPRLPVSFIYLGRELKTTSAAEAPPPAPPSRTGLCVFALLLSV